MEWKLADAKNRFREFFNLALSKLLQRVVRRNESVIVLSEDECEMITRKIPSFNSFLLNGPSLEGLDLSRGKSTRPDLYLH